MDALSEFLGDLYCLSTLSSVTYSSIKILCTHMNTHTYTNLPSSISPPSYSLKSSTKGWIHRTQIPSITKSKRACMSVVCFTWAHSEGVALKCVLGSVQPTGNRDREVVKETLHSTDQTLIVGALCFPPGVVLTLMKAANHCQICSSALNAWILWEDSCFFFFQPNPPNHLGKTHLFLFFSLLPIPFKTQREMQIIGEVKNESVRWKAQSKKQTVSCLLFVFIYSVSQEFTETSGEPL